MKKLFCLLPILFCLTGCYNYRELNDLAIVTGISVQKIGEEYQVTAEVVNPKKQQDNSGVNEPDFIIYKTTGTSMQEAFRNVVKESPRKLYGAQLEILIIDEETAKDEINMILDFLSRDPEIRSEFYVLIGKSDEVLEVTTPLENISSKNIFSSLTATNQYLGTSNLVTYHELINDYLNPNIEIALPSIEIVHSNKDEDSIKNIEETDSETDSVISTIAVFKKDKLVGYLTEKESLAYNFIMGNTQTSLIRTEYENNEFVVHEIIDSKTKMEADVSKKKITISISGKAALSEVNYDCDLKNVNTIKKLQKDLNREMESLLKESIQSSIQKYNSDIYGFRDLFYKTDPQEYEQLKDKWYQEIFSKLEIEVKSEIQIIEKGNLNGGLYHE